MSSLPSLRSPSAPLLYVLLTNARAGPARRPFAALDAGAAQATPFTGMVTGQRIAVFARLPLDSGAVLAPAAVAYKTWGTLNAARDNVMVVCHALSGTCDVADWWGPLLGRGKAFDPAVFFIVCANVLGSPYGTSSPVSINPATQRRTAHTHARAHTRSGTRLTRAGGNAQKQRTGPTSPT